MESHQYPESWPTWDENSAGGGGSIGIKKRVFPIILRGYNGKPTKLKPPIIACLPWLWWGAIGYLITKLGGGAIMENPKMGGGGGQNMMDLKIDQVYVIIL